MNILRTLLGLFARSVVVRPKATTNPVSQDSWGTENRFQRLKSVAASGQSGCRDAQAKLRAATHAGLRQAVGR